ncbi:MAG: MoxR family ATPase [Alphaproteobacteria bacterium]|nr:MoxR family ATPase [Alphaproteobacteria bacterium]
MESHVSNPNLPPVPGAAKPEVSAVKRHFLALKEYMNASIIGQEDLIERLLISLLADGHLLVEGAPGLAKTKALKRLSEALEGESQRIQFTPDLLPADITGSDIYHPETGKFSFQPGPIFHNLVLADEINRAPAKVQSALLEAMAERQVTVGGQTYLLPQLFMVMATQNPIEQEGTYPLPEAQLDRFLMYVKIDQPNIEAERQILKLVREENMNAGRINSFKPMAQDIVFSARREVMDVYLSPSLEEYIVQLVMATRNPAPYGEKLAKWINFGASPRGTIALDRCARVRTWLAGRDFVMPEDVHAVAHDVLRHRIILTFEAEAEGITTDSFLDVLLSRVPLP